MPIQGLRHTDNFATNERPQNWREAILRLEPNGMAPLTALTSMMKSESTDDPIYNWWQKNTQERRVALSAGVTAAQQNLAVVSGALGFKRGDLLMAEATQEIVVVVQDPTIDTALMVTRGFAGSTSASTSATQAGDNPNFRCIGSAYEEGSEAPTGVGFDPVQYYNYTQIFRNTLEMTRTAAKTRLRTGDQVKEAKRECLELHSIDMEMAFWFGKRAATTFGGKPWRTTNGIYQSILLSASQNIITAATAGITMTLLEGYLKDIFKYGSSQKMCFTGNSGILVLNQVIRRNSQYNIEFGAKEYGMRIARLTCPFGEVVFKTHPLFNQMSGGTTAGTAYTGLDTWMFFLDMKNVLYRYLDDSDTKYQKDLQSNGLDGMKSGYLSECGLEVQKALTHYVIKSFALAATTVDN